jgi:hypothetical protein
MVTEKSKQILNFFVLLLFAGVILGVFPLMIGLGGSGFDSEKILQLQSFYLTTGGVFLILLILCFILEYIIKKGDERYGENNLFASVGESPSIPLFKKVSQFKILFLSIIFFSILGLIVFVTKQATFTGIKPLAQQFTPTSELIYTTLLIPVAENLGLAVILFLTILSVRMLARKGNWSKTNFNIVTWVSCIFFGIAYWLINHLLRYRGADFDLMTIAGFGLMMTLLTLATGSFIPAWIMHIANNLFYDMQRLFSRDNVIIFVVMVIIALIFLYVFTFRKKKNEVNLLSNVS